MVDSKKTGESQPADPTAPGGHSPWTPEDVHDVVETTRVVAGAATEAARGVRSDVGLALDARRDGRPVSGGLDGGGHRAESVIRALTRWQGNDTTSLVRALQGSFQRTEAHGRSVVRYRGPGRWSPLGSTTTPVGPDARVLRRISPLLSDIRDLLHRLEPVAPDGDPEAVRSAAAAVADRLDSYAEELGRGFEARQARLRALRLALRGPDDDQLGGLLEALRAALAVDLDEAAASEADEVLVEDYLTLVDFVYQLDGTPPPTFGTFGPVEWRDGVEEALAGAADELTELDTRLQIFAVTPAQQEAEEIEIDDQRQSVAEILAWADTLVRTDAPRLLEGSRRADAELAIDAELAELRPWVSALRGTDLFTEPLLRQSGKRVSASLRALSDALTRRVR